MYKKHLILIPFLAIGFCAISHAQSEQKAIKAVINRFFEGLETGDTTLLKSTCTDKPLLQSYVQGRDGKWKVVTEEFSSFVRIIGTPHKDKYHEAIKFKGLHVEPALASVWTPYTFYLNDKVSHCGTNSFQLVKTDAGWKIQYIIDTRKKDCK